MGQENPVTIYHLVSSGSQEEKRIIGNQRKARMSHYMIKEQCVLESEVDKKLRERPAPVSANFAIDCNEDVIEILNTATHDCQEYEKIFSESLKGLLPNQKPSTVPRTPPALPQARHKNSRTSPPHSQFRNPHPPSHSRPQPGSPPVPLPPRSQSSSYKQRMSQKRNTTESKFCVYCSAEERSKWNNIQLCILCCIPPNGNKSCSYVKLVDDYEAKFGQWNLQVERNFSELIMKKYVCFTEYMRKKYYWLAECAQAAPSPSKSSYKENKQPSKPSLTSPPQPMCMRSRRSKERSPSRDEDEEKASVLHPARESAPDKRSRDPSRLIPVPGLSFEISTIYLIFFCW